MPGPLDGFRVIEATTMITGPLATMILGDQGADVVKLEAPGIGDVMRYLGTKRAGMSTLWALCNRSKRSVVVDLKNEQGIEVVRKLVAQADVFVQNYRPGVVERLGLDEKTLRGVNPELIYVSISAYGQAGPYAKRPAYDHIIQGIAGAAGVQQRPGSGEPEHVRNALMDKVTAKDVAQGITAALLARERGRGGQHIRVSMLDAGISFLWPDGGANETLIDAEPGEIQPSISVSYRVDRASDGHFCVAAITDPQAHGLFRAMGKPELVEDPRFATIEARIRNVPALLAALTFDDAPDFTREEILSRLDAEGVPCGPVYAIGEVPGDPQVVANDTFTTTAHPQLGRIRQPRPPVQFEATPGGITRPAPAMGADTTEVLGELGFAADEIDALRTAGVVG